jgi:hypothetical protein
MPNNNPQPQTINQIATELDAIIANFLKQKKNRSYRQCFNCYSWCAFVNHGKWHRL